MLMCYASQLVVRHHGKVQPWTYKVKPSETAVVGPWILVAIDIGNRECARTCSVWSCSGRNTSKLGSEDGGGPE